MKKGCGTVLLLSVLFVAGVVFAGCVDEDMSEHKLLVSISVSDKSEHIIQFSMSSSFSYAGLKIVRTYNDGSMDNLELSSDTEKEFTVLAPSLLSVGEKEVKIEYVLRKKVSASYLVTVLDSSASKVTELKIHTPKVSTVFLLGESFSLCGITVKAVYANLAEEVVTDYTTEQDLYNSSEVGKYIIVIKYMDISAEYEVSVIAHPFSNTRWYSDTVLNGLAAFCMSLVFNSSGEVARYINGEKQPYLDYVLERQGDRVMISDIGYYDIAKEEVFFEGKYCVQASEIVLSYSLEGFNGVLIAADGVLNQLQIDSLLEYGVLYTEPASGQLVTTETVFNSDAEIFLRFSTKREYIGFYELEDEENSLVEITDLDIRFNGQSLSYIAKEQGDNTLLKTSIGDFIHINLSQTVAYVCEADVKIYTRVDVARKIIVHTLSNSDAYASLSRGFAIEKGSPFQALWQLDMGFVKYQFENYNNQALSENTVLSFSTAIIKESEYFSAVYGRYNQYYSLDFSSSEIKRGEREYEYNSTFAVRDVDQDNIYLSFSQRRAIESVVITTESESCLLRVGDEVFLRYDDGFYTDEIFSGSFESDSKERLYVGGNGRIVYGNMSQRFSLTKGTDSYIFTVKEISGEVVTMVYTISKRTMTYNNVQYRSVKYATEAFVGSFIYRGEKQEIYSNGLTTFGGILKVEKHGNDAALYLENGEIHYYRMQNDTLEASILKIYKRYSEPYLGATFVNVLYFNEIHGTLQIFSTGYISLNGLIIGEITSESGGVFSFYDYVKSETTTLIISGKTLSLAGIQYVDTTPPPPVCEGMPFVSKMFSCDELWIKISNSGVIENSENYDWQVESVTISADGKYILCIQLGNEQTIFVYDLSTNTFLLFDEYVLSEI